MFPPASSFRTSLLWVLACLAPVAASRAQPPDPVTQETRVPSLFVEPDRFFAQNPHLQTTPGSGWNPYNRFKWFVQQRMEEGHLPPAGARWAAWEDRQAREAQAPPGPAWFSLGPVNFGGRLLAVDFDPTDPATVYVGAAGGGVFKSTNGGASWLPIADGIPSLAVGGIAVCPTNPDVVVLGTGEATLNGDRIGGVGILRSTDAGATWIPTSLTHTLGLGAGAHGFHVVTAGLSGTMLAGAIDGLFRSTDEGATWTQVMPVLSAPPLNDGWYDVQWDPEMAARVYAVKGNDTAGNGVYVSTDDGFTWGTAGVGQPPSGEIGKSKLAVSGDTVYLYAGEQGFGGGVTGLFRSADDGATWTPALGLGLPTGQSWYNLACVADPDAENRVMCGAVSLSQSVDGGWTFAPIGAGVHVDYHQLRYEPGQALRLWAVTDGGAWLSVSDGVAIPWQDMNNGLVTFQFYDICVNNGPDPYYAMGGTQDNGTDKWSGTTTWADGLGGDGMVCNVDPANGTTVYAEVQRGSHYKSTDSGVSFTTINNGIATSGRWVTPVDQDQIDTQVLYTEAGDGLYKTTNGGSVWWNVSSARAVWISVSPVNADVVWTINGGAVRRSPDAGATWPLVAGFPFTIGQSTKVIAHPTDASTAFATFASYGNAAVRVAMTADDGATWQDVTGDLPKIPVNGIAVNPLSPSDWYLATDLGVWHSSDDGAQWLPFGNGLPNVVVCDVEIQRSLQKLVAGTHGRGAWEVDIDSSTGAEAPARRVHGNLLMDAPSPNPARGRTMLRFAARSESTVRLSVYDVTGRRVSVLETLRRGDGVIRTVPWLTDGVPPGVYMAVLEAGTDRLTRKITVVE